MQKLWVKRAKRRRVLAEVEQSAAGDSQGPELLMQEVGVAFCYFVYVCRRVRACVCFVFFLCRGS